MPCDDFFEARNIRYDAGDEDLAVYTAHHDAGKDQHYAKWLIQCWFDTTHGRWSSDRFDNTAGRDAMRDFLARTAYDTFEQLLADPNYGGTHAATNAPETTRAANRR